MVETGEAIDLGLIALVRMQRADGSFPVEPNPDRPPILPLDPIFSTASVVLACGAKLPPASLASATNYLVSRRRRDSLWEWSGCPADADDTALCLAALSSSCKIGRPETAALFRFWREPSGPFQTWLPGFGTELLPDDPVVNCNVVYCLAQMPGGPYPEVREAVSDFVVRSLCAERHFSEYYCCMSTLVYAAARAGLAKPILDLVSNYLVDQKLTPQQTSEVLAAHPHAPTEYVTAILDAQVPDGRWKGSPWFFDPNGDFCSDAYATAVAIEGLSRWQSKQAAST